MADGRNSKKAALQSVPAGAHGAAPGPADVLMSSPMLRVQGAIEMLAALADLRWASIWARDGAGVVRCVCEAGDAPSRPVGRQVARRLLDGEDEEHAHRRVLLGIALGGHAHPLAALVGRADAGERERCLALLAEASSTLDGLLLGDIRDAERSASERAQLHATERRLTRVGLDLHDGPVQELAALASDVRLFGEQLEPLAGEGSERALLRGRIEDLEAQLNALDDSLREISSEVRAPRTVSRRRFRAALEEAIRAFDERSGVRPKFMLAGPVGTLSDSQQIALVNIVAEALSNVRKHADAHTVEVVVRVGADGAEATIADDGRGFDPDAKRARGARSGHAGLFAIRERVRLLGGSCMIESRPGGPTFVRVALPRWTPATQREAAQREQSHGAQPQSGHAVAAAGARNGASSFSTA